ncbi:hypothetical protein Tco_0626675 [Tanacetum coccineum]|uniref:Uncharacterized protein n=1 Tax=Tanacetum coccineum TaxID=301880 RepID=A0ABQ4WKG5_9ASTR
MPRITTPGLLFLVSFASLLILRLLSTFLSKELLLLWLGDDVERLWNELARLGTSMKVLEVKEHCKLLGSKGGELLRPVEILEREFKKLKRSRIAIVKVWSNSKCGPEFTWEHDDEMKLKYPHLFSDVSS